MPKSNRKIKLLNFLKFLKFLKFFCIHFYLIHLTSLWTRDSYRKSRNVQIFLPPKHGYLRAYFFFKFGTLNSFVNLLVQKVFVWQFGPCYDPVDGIPPYSNRPVEPLTQEEEKDCAPSIDRLGRWCRKPHRSNGLRCGNFTAADAYLKYVNGLGSEIA